MRISDWSSDVCSSDLVIVHGDYRLGNVLCLEDRVTAIIDWEIWALGDPRTDVTWLTFFTDEAAHPAAEPGPPSGMPGKKDLIAAYEERAGRQLPDMDWFAALTKSKESSEEHPSELQSLMRISYAVFCLANKYLIS